MAPFADQKYLNLESYRKSGEPVRTPVWFAQDGRVLYTYSRADAGKVKRIRNNPRIRMAPCDVRGRLNGDWVDAEARIEDRAGAEHGHGLLDRKYGLVKKLGDAFSRMMKRQRVVISIRV
ncbi:MAG TPA: PPOX class F420-dependent oxidoreductase [Blastocatellia bacterium]|nr:PPOX class F420-dependent oxidoreductase [Blastocatellia bacterium]